MSDEHESENTILPDINQEALRLLGAAGQEAVPIRLLGGVAVLVRVPDPPPALQRSIEDIDFAAPKGGSREISDFFRRQGYEPQTIFNATHGASRLIFDDPKHGRHVDVFVGKFQMCHELQFGDRLELEPQTLPLAELVMTKLQIVKLNPKDLTDLALLLLNHEVADHDRDSINGEQIAYLCAHDWGTYKTFQVNLERMPEMIRKYDLSDEQLSLFDERVTELRRVIEMAPKSRKWKIRARVGDRVRWYDDPEEVEEIAGAGT